jgi:cation diffusion facilitator CzcD-associated flavoprotein CzcO
MTTVPKQYDAIIIGAGQAGLSLAARFDAAGPVNDQVVVRLLPAQTQRAFVATRP